MYLDELINKIYEEKPEIEAMAAGHNVGFADSLNELPIEITAQVQETAREEFGDIIELYHGTETELAEDLDWRENSSFTNEFDIEFSGEDGYIIVAQIPVARIKFYLPTENEFVISAGQLECEVYSVSEYFDL